MRLVERTRRIVRGSNFQKDWFHSTCLRPLDQFHEKPRPKLFSAGALLYHDILEFTFRVNDTRHKKPLYATIDVYHKDDSLWGRVLEKPSILVLRPVRYRCASPFKRQQTRHVRRDCRAHTLPFTCGSRPGLVFWFQAKDVKN